jgi:ABC-2 type transport system ATP-binding protein
MSGMLRTVDLVKSFGDAPVLTGLNLEVPEGSVYGMLGPNGVGKTTTILIAMNILQPTSGNVEVMGVPSRNLGPSDFTRIGYVSENQELPEWMTVAYLLRYLKPFYPSWDQNYAEQLVRQFDLPLSRDLRRLSRGMRMKAALVGALAYRPRLLVLDEPFSGLDPLVREEVIEGLIESASETTIFISSHDLGEIESFASHIGYLDRGRLQFSEEMSSLTARFREVEVTVEPPAKLPTDRDWPKTWLRPETTAAVIRFVETQFEPDRTASAIRSIFGPVRGISANPMSLRAIFVTLARSGSRA